MTKSDIYKALKVSNDINAVQKGKIVKRVKNRLLGRFFRRFFRW